MSLRFHSFKSLYILLEKRIHLGGLLSLYAICRYREHILTVRPFESLVETKCKLRQCELYSTKNLDKLGKPYLQENYICVLQW